MIAASASTSRAGFPGVPESAGQARSFVSGVLAEAGRPEVAETAVLLVSELVSNVVLHAGTDLEVVVRLGGERLTVEVHDQGGGRAVRHHYSPLSGTGRGLVLVEELARDWGTVVTEHGKYVWFELDLHRDPSGAVSPQRAAAG